LLKLPENQRFEIVGFLALLGRILWFDPRRRPFAMVDVYGTPYTDSLHVVERYRLIDREAAIEAHARTGKENISIPNNDSGLIIDAGYPGKALQLEFTVEDDGVFTMPWSASMTYRRAAGAWPASRASHPN
jgi:hypothetical protein